MSGSASCGNTNDRQYLLTPCPFCGKGIARFVTCQEVRACGGWRACEEGRYLSIACSFQDGGCGASSGFFPTAQEAADAWNRREGSVRIEALEKLLADNSYGKEQP